MTVYFTGLTSDNLLRQNVAVGRSHIAIVTTFHAYECVKINLGSLKSLCVSRTNFFEANLLVEGDSSFVSHLHVQIDVVDVGVVLGEV